MKVWLQFYCCLMMGKTASPILSLSDLNLLAIHSVCNCLGGFYADSPTFKVWAGGTTVAAVIICFLFVAVSPAHM